MPTLPKIFIPVLLPQNTYFFIWPPLLLNLLNELRKRDKIQDYLSNDTETILKSCLSEKTLKNLQYICEVVMAVNT